MNVHIGAYLNFEGLRAELTPLLDDIADAMVKHGFGNIEETDNLISVVIVGDSGVADYPSADEFARMLLKDAYTVIIPIKEDDNGDTSSGS